MADEDDDKIIETKNIKEALKELKELEAVISRLRDKTSEERDTERLISYEAIQEYASKEKEAIQERVEYLRDAAELQKGIERDLLNEKADNLETLLDMTKREREDYAELVEDKIRQNDALSQSLGLFRDALDFTLDLGTVENAKALASALGIIGLFGIKPPNFADIFKEYAVAFDDARRSIVPFATSISDANDLQQKFLSTSADTKIPITDLGESVGTTASQFGMFALQGTQAQAALVGLQAQLKNMGVESGTSIVQSIMSEGGIASAEDATDVFKALVVRMKDLGVMPKTLTEDYNKLIGTFSMFGDAAQMNIARTSLAAAKAKVDVGAITGFGDNFSGYSQAASTAQQINAIFGRRIIDNPAELVSIFYTGGGEAALEYVKRKLVTSGVDLEEMLGGAAGAARLRMLGGMGFGSAQAARRALLSDTAITPAEAEGIQGAGPTADLSARFNALAEEMLTMQDRVNQTTEQQAAKLFQNIGVPIGEMGKMFTGMLKNVELVFETLRKGTEDLATTQPIGGVESFDPKTGEPRPATMKNIIQDLMSGEQKQLNDTLEEVTTSQNNNTEQLKRLNTNLENMAPAATGGGGGEQMAAATPTEGTRVTLVVNGTEMNAYLKGAIDRIAKGRA
jgi:hypothetical protein